MAPDAMPDRPRGRRCLRGCFVVVLLLVLVLVLVLGILVRETPTPPLSSKLVRRRDEVHLLTQWYTANATARRAECAAALWTNLRYAPFTRVHVLQPAADVDADARALEAAVCAHARAHDGDTADACAGVLATRLVVVPVGALPRDGRLTARAALAYAAGPRLRGTTVVVANLDISFDSSLQQLRRADIDLSAQQAYALSRWELDEAQSLLGTQCGDRYVGSHDALVVVPPVPEAVLARLDVALGTWGVENRVMWELEQAGLAVRNPCRDVRSWHHHASASRPLAAELPVVNDPHRSSVAHPDRLFASAYRLYTRAASSATTIADGTVVALRGATSGLCLFARSDGKFGHAPCNGRYVDQHFVWVADSTRPAAAWRDATLAEGHHAQTDHDDDDDDDGDKNELVVEAQRVQHPLSTPARLVSRQAGTCIVATAPAGHGPMLLAHTACAAADADCHGHGVARWWRLDDADGDDGPPHLRLVLAHAPHLGAYSGLGDRLGVGAWAEPDATAQSTGEGGSDGRGGEGSSGRAGHASSRDYLWVVDMYIPV